ncbi:iron-utilization periplasmic protein [Pseudonocardia sulfidoxydans NBRC 16205]|uniref:Iron-utilization periplasmic protein n=2 Tax=Pseudonocardia sulfidoxydans TaxID=54011 RepID=A0A511DPA1_9PSEU|nr:iron-utilization periplasmic protein [Pseudonocardia sulfidoxydans NBRC 16205]
MTAAVATILGVTLAACGGSGGSTADGSDPAAGSATDTATLTVYTDQHADLIKGLTDAYTAETGVEFNIQNDATVGQIEAEGGAGKADVFLSEDPTPVAQLGAAGLLAPVDQTTLDQVRPGLSSPKGLWAAYAARSRVLYYNPTVISQDQLPKTLAEIVEPQYAGKFAWAPSGAFVATTQYLIATQGEAKTTTFLEGIKANGVNEQKNGNVRDTVEAGKHAMGLSNHYYWWVLAGQKGGPDKLVSKIYHFPAEDAGNLVLSSGAGVLKASTHQAEAQKFIAWVTSKDGGQKLIADAPAEVSEAQYPVAPGVASSIAGDLSEVKSPAFDMDELADSSQAEDLLKQLGLSKG